MTRADYFHILELKIDTKHTTKTLSITYWEFDLAEEFGTHVEDSSLLVKEQVSQNTSFVQPKPQKRFDT